MSVRPSVRPSRQSLRVMRRSTPPCGEELTRAQRNAIQFCMTETDADETTQELCNALEQQSNHVRALHGRTPPVRPTYCAQSKAFDLKLPLYHRHKTPNTPMTR